MNKIFLILEGKNRTIQIPFKDISSLDEFTVSYNNDLELIDILNRLLDLKIRDIHSYKVKVKNVYKSKYKDNQYIYRELPVKYYSDNFNLGDLEIVYANFYKDNHKRIIDVRNGIINVKSDAIYNYINGIKDITDREIDLAILSYFKNGGYKKYRDAYFLLKENGYMVKNKDNIIRSGRFDRTDLNNYQILDKYFSYLRNYANNGTDEHEEVMDILSGYDIDEIKKLVRNSHYGLFDGEGILKKQDDTLNDQLLALLSLTGFSYDELMKYIDEYNIPRGRKR